MWPVPLIRWHPLTIFMPWFASTAIRTCSLSLSLSADNSAIPCCPCCQATSNLPCKKQRAHGDFVKTNKHQQLLGCVECAALKAWDNDTIWLVTTACICTIPETNIASENRPSQEETSTVFQHNVFQPSIFRCYVSFRDGSVGLSPREISLPGFSCGVMYRTMA